METSAGGNGRTGGNGQVDVIFQHVVHSSQTRNRRPDSFFRTAASIFELAAN